MHAGLSIFYLLIVPKYPGTSTPTLLYEGYQYWRGIKFQRFEASPDFHVSNIIIPVELTLKGKNKSSPLYLHHKYRILLLHVNPWQAGNFGDYPTPTPTPTTPVHR